MQQDDTMQSYRAYLTPLLSEEQQRGFIERIQHANKVGTHDRAAEEAFLRANIGLVIRFARPLLRITRRIIDFDDLMQEGWRGLLIAAQKFDVSSPNHVSTYAAWWIRQCMTRYLMAHDPLIHIPNHQQHRLKKHERMLSLHDAEAEVDSSKPLSATEEEEMQRAFASFLQEAQQANRWIHSLDARFNDDEGQENTLSALLADPRPTPEAQVEQELFRQEIQIVFSQILTDEEYRILELRNGLFGASVTTYEDTARALHLTRERIRQAEQRAKNKLARSERLQHLYRSLEPETHYVQ